MKLYQILIYSCLLTLTACLQNRRPRVSQQLEGTFTHISDIAQLKCTIKTGEALNQKVDWTDARQVYLEDKSSKGYTPLKKGETVVYDGFDPKTNKPQKGYINQFGYVPIVEIKDSRGKKITPSKKDGLIKKNQLYCDNLLTPKQHNLLIAKPHHTYDLRFQITGNFLRALIVASPKDIPFQALPYSVKFKDDLYGMPIGGYEVKLGYLEEVVNSDWEATRVLTFREIPITNQKGLTNLVTNEKPKVPFVYPEKSTVVKVINDFEPFATLLESGEKRDVYPKNLVAGPWHYLKTQTHSQINQNHFIGWQPHATDHYLDTKIRIDIKDNYIVGYSLNKEKNVKKGLESFVNRDRWVFKIPIQHISYEASSSLSGQVLNGGLNEILNKRKDDHEKEFIKINFNQIEFAKFDFSSLRKPSYRVQELKFSKDYLSFVLYDDVSESRTRYSFLRPKQNTTYSPLTVSEKGINLFPAFFSGTRVSDLDHNIHGKDSQKQYRVHRFNTKEPIVYKFSTLTPKEDYVRNIGREAISLWNQVFQKAGISCAQKDCFVLDEREDASLGDIRYNILNLTDPKDIRFNSFYLGLGPSFVDSETGEIISSTSNIILNKTYNAILRNIDQYLMSSYNLDITYWKALKFSRQSRYSRSETSNYGLHLLRRAFFNGNLQKSLIPSVFMYNFSHVNPSDLNLPQNIIQSLNKRVPFYGLHLDESNPKKVNFVTSLDQIFSREEDKKELALHYQMATGKPLSSDLTLEEIQSSINKSKSSSHSCSLQASQNLSGESVYSLIDQFCPEVKKFTILEEEKDLSPHEVYEVFLGQTETDQFKATAYKCAEKIMPLLALETLTHEIGHNISMFHNFSGSSDKDNFLSHEDFKLNYVFSDFEEDEIQKFLEMDFVQPSTSTVMDYSSFQVVNIIPGNYDVGFVRFIYGEQLEDRENNLLSVDVESLKNLENEEEVKTASLRNFNVCTDITYHRLNEDPFCQQRDAGTTPFEIIQNEFNYWVSYHNNFIAFSYRSLPMYHKWRLELARHKQSSYDPYFLTDASTEDYKNMKQEICGDDQKTGHPLYSLCKASELIHKAYIQQIFFNPDQYCIVKHSKTQQRDKIPLRDLKREFLTEDLRSSCKDFRSYLSRSGYLLDRQTPEIGRPFYPTQFSTNKNHIKTHTRFDRMGSALNKLYAVLGLARSSFHNISIFEGIQSPISIMDEPDIREKIHNLLRRRLFQGDVSYLGNAGNSPSVFSYNFSNEYLLLDLAKNLFFINFNRTNIIKNFQNNIKSLWKIIPLDRKFIKAPSPVNLKYLDIYSEMKSNGGHILNDSKEIYPEGTPPLMAIPYYAGDDSHSNEFIEAIKRIELRKSAINIWKKYKAMKKELKDQDFEKLNFKNKLKQALEANTTDKIQAAFILMNHPDVTVNIATTSLLHDYLERGESAYLLTDSLIQYLQLLKGLKLKEALVSSLGEQELAPTEQDSTQATDSSEELKTDSDQINCPKDMDDFCASIREQLSSIQGDVQELNNPHIPTPDRVQSIEEDLKIEDYLNFFKEDGRNVSTLDVFRHNLNFLLKHFEKYPDQILEHSQDVLTIYLLDFFKSKKYDNSSTRVEIEKLIDLWIEKANSKMTKKTNKQILFKKPKKIIGFKDSKIAFIDKDTDLDTLVQYLRFFLKSVNNLKELHYFRNNYLFREGLLRELYYTGYRDPIEFDSFRFRRIFNKSASEILEEGNFLKLFLYAVHVGSLPNVEISFQVMAQIGAVLNKPQGQGLKSIFKKRKKMFFRNFKKLISVLDPIVNHPEEFNELLLIFRTQIGPVIENYFSEKSEYIQSGKNFKFPYFLRSDEDLLSETAPLRRYFQNRTEKELQNQTDLIYDSAIPILDIF